jgi:hypothetical protein
MPRLVTLKPQYQHRVLVQAHDTLSGLLTRMGRIPCHTLQHDEQQLMVTVYMGLERERDTIAAALNLTRH